MDKLLPYVDVKFAAFLLPHRTPREVGLYGRVRGGRLEVYHRTGCTALPADLIELDTPPVLWRLEVARSAREVLQILTDACPSYEIATLAGA